jgi:hypothetical protein
MAYPSAPSAIWRTAKRYALLAYRNENLTSTKIVNKNTVVQIHQFIMRIWLLNL